MKRLICFILSIVLFVGLLPVNARAEGSGSFILVVEAGDKLVIEPEYVAYEAGQTIGEVLVNSGHTFTGIEDGWITAIDDVVGNYTRSDENGKYDLNALASEIGFFRFCEEEEPQISEGIQMLMTAMADYAKKDADVKAAAKKAYDRACEQFVGLDSESAAVLAEDLNEAVSNYENSQNDIKKVTFTDGNSIYTDVSIELINAYGKKWNDDGDGVMELPVGEYSFCVQNDGLMAEGNISVSEDMEVNVQLPEEMWLALNKVRVSGSYEAQDEEDGKFSDDEYDLGEWNGRSLTVPVSDTFTGKIYTYFEYHEERLSELPEMEAIYKDVKTGEEIRQELPFESFTSGISSVLKKGSDGNSVIYRISSQGNDGYTYSQDYIMNFTRVPTLKGITVKDQKGTDQAATTAFDGNQNEYTYKILDSVTAVTVEADPLEAAYEVMIDGQNAKDGVSVPVEGNTEIAVEVKAGDYSNIYTLHVCPGEGKELSFVTESADVTLEVVNSNGQVMPYAKYREGQDGNRYQYTLVPGETYSYVATANNYYHIADEFTMEESADSTITVDVETDDWLKELAFGMKESKKSKGSLPLDKEFQSEDHKYQVSYVDTEHNAYVWLTVKDDVKETVKIQAVYDQIFSNSLYHGKKYTINLDSDKSTGVQLKRFLMDENPIENTVTIRLSKEVSGTTHYQDYVVDFTRELTLGDIQAKCNGVTTTLIQMDETLGFDSDVKEYSVKVSMAADTLELETAAYTENKCYGEDQVGYVVEVDGQAVGEDGKVVIPLDGTINTQNVTITVKNDKAPNGTSEYILHILKSPPVSTAFEINPETAMLAMYETMSGERIWADGNGKYQLCEGYSYRYTLTAYNYVSKAGTLEVTRDSEKALVVKDGETDYKVEETEDGGGMLTISWKLEKAQENSSIQSDMEAEWKNFRGDDSNNALTGAAIPKTAEEGTLYWANQIGKGYSADAVGSPIIVDGDLVTYAGSKIYRVDTVTGEVKVTGDMDHKSAHATTPPSYAEGMVFVALTDGTVQAFNAKTLESLWIYKDPLGGQPVCPLTIKNGYLYTGFWNNETGDANFVCLSITDEDINRTDEDKCVSWYYTTEGGYYWAGAYVSDDFVMVGTDDGTTSCTGKSSTLLLFDPVTGKLLDSLEELNGDIRSTVVFDETTNAYYFTSKGGTFYSVQVEKADTGWKLTNKWSVDLTNGTTGTPMSTCSPTVYNGRAYVGVSGIGQFSAYSGHNITVIDLNKKAIAYSVETQGYPQTSGLLTTAYEEESGYVYVYFFDNMTPGKLRVLRDKKGQTKADYTTTERNESVAYALFTPTGDHAQYAICSPIVDEYGTIFFKNDSAYMMAYGSRIQKIEVTKAPKKMVYADGEKFNPKGMVVTATYVNGKTRDITQYVKYDIDTVTADKTTVTISFPYVMYHNEENGTEMSSGVVTTTPRTTLNLTIGESEPDVEDGPGDVNEDGLIDEKDAEMIISYYYEEIQFTEEQQKTADVNEDGGIDTVDANMIIFQLNTNMGES